MTSVQYVRNLPEDLSNLEESLNEKITEMAPDVQVKNVYIDDCQGRKGRAEVHFHSDADAEQTMDIMAYKLWRGKSMHYMSLQPKDDLRESTEANLIVHNIEKSISERELFDKSKPLVVYHPA